MGAKSDLWKSTWFELEVTWERIFIHSSHPKYVELNLTGWSKIRHGLCDQTKSCKSIKLSIFSFFLELFNNNSASTLIHDLRGIKRK